MTMNKILLFSFLTILTYCNGQEKVNTGKELNTFEVFFKIREEIYGLAPLKA
jgi:hypothetical protein